MRAAVLIDRDMVDVRQPYARLSKAIPGNCARGKSRPMLDPAEPFFFRGGDQFSIAITSAAEESP